ncbi:prepilin-type N-terminal cleavage/methylation domain-containing protein [Paenibacillus sp. LMG 31459]|uniref:Prepilin-type N-terminal cleavage/methylation domain-containing protein n=1 Tax=Paenibacillus phytohabitans TaxID=2654978 RepID=A0ABX1YH60_9BACL|nr:prepilin-type N-terminal cleavage/methylation domain-containing protein [Paenibacillus phytohabitans]NOU79208.1 prepilin-type N-terminal cleavage/methylation domain-containing protein [Paenibacillus phytohabitans]
MLAQAIRKKLGKAVKEEKGFTLIELLAVIVIIGIISIIAVPLIGNIIKDSRDNADVATARQVYDAARLYIVGEKNGAFTDTTVVNIVGAAASDTLQGKGYLDAKLYLPSTKKEITGGTVNFAAGKLTSVVLVWGTGTNDKNTFTDIQVLSSKK